jgi:hypothetical protein
MTQVWLITCVDTGIGCGDKIQFEGAFWRKDDADKVFNHGRLAISGSTVRWSCKLINLDACPTVERGYLYAPMDALQAIDDLKDYFYSDPPYSDEEFDLEDTTEYGIDEETGRVK